MSKGTTKCITEYKRVYIKLRYHTITTEVKITLTKHINNNNNNDTLSCRA